MCGIVGVFNLKNDPSCVVDRQTKGFLMDFFLTELLLQTEARGKDATGYFAMFEDGNTLGLKHSLSASDFIYKTTFDDGLNYYEHVRAMEKYHNETAELVSIIGHCRKSTVGNKQNINNHPVVLDNEIACVHNGTFTNTDKIIDQHKDDFKPVGDVDSEMVVQLARLWQKENGNEFDINTCKYILDRTDGGCATIITSTKSMYKIAWMRYDRPLYASYLKGLGLLIMASDRDYIENTLELYNRLVLYQMNLPAYTSIITSVSYDHSGIIDLEVDPTTIEGQENAVYVDKLLGSTKLERKLIEEYKSTYSRSQHYQYNYTSTSTKRCSIAQTTSSTTQTKTKSNNLSSNACSSNSTSTTPTKTDSKTATAPTKAAADKNANLIKVYSWAGDHYERVLMDKSYVEVSSVKDLKDINIDELFKGIPMLREHTTNPQVSDKMDREFDEMKCTMWTASSVQIAHAAELNTLRRVAPMIIKAKKTEASAFKARKRIFTLKKFISGMLNSVVSMTTAGLEDYNLDENELKFIHKLIPERVFNNAPNLLQTYINEKIGEKTSEVEL